MTATATATAARPYRGKYPHRIVAVSGITGQPHMIQCQTNAGERYQAATRDCIIAGYAKSPSEFMGRDARELDFLQPFQTAFNRALAEIVRANGGKPGRAATPSEIAEAMTADAAEAIDSAQAIQAADAAETAIQNDSAADCVILNALDTFQEYRTHGDKERNARAFLRQWADYRARRAAALVAAPASIAARLAAATDRATR